MKETDERVNETNEGRNEMNEGKIEIKGKGKAHKRKNGSKEGG